MNLITYDLVSPNDTPADYKRVIDGIKALYPRHLHMEKSVWIVETDETPNECYAQISGLLKPNDRWLVVRMRKWSAHKGYRIKKTFGMT